MTTLTSNAFTVDDLEAMPDDGKRYELIGGAIVMTPASEPVHQRVVLGLADNEYQPYADSSDPITVDWPVGVSFSVADLARPRAL